MANTNHIDGQLCKKDEKNSPLSKILILLIPLFSCCYTSIAQPTPMQLANAELRNLFQFVGNPHPNIKFFYDLSAHQVDSQYFGHYNLDTSNNSVWYALYEEMRWMPYDTNWFQNPLNILTQADPFIAHDTIPIGIMDWDYNLLHDSALATGTYFIFDTVFMIRLARPTRMVFSPHLLVRL